MRPRARSPCADKEVHGIGVAFSADGTRLAVCPNFGSNFPPVPPQVLDAATGRVVRRFNFDGGTYAVALSPDGQTLASAGWDCAIRLRSVATGNDLLPLLGASGMAQAVDLSRDGKRLAVCNLDGTVRLHDAVTGRVTLTAPVRFSENATMQLSPDGKRLVVLDNVKRSQVLDAVTGKELVPLGDQPFPLRRAAVSRDGRTLVFEIYDGAVHVWDLAASKELRVLEGGAGLGRHFGALALSPDGRLLAVAVYGPAGGSQNVEIWETATGRNLRVCAGFKHTPTFGLTFSPDGRSLAAGNDDGNICVWEVATGGLRYRLRGKQKSVSALAFAADGRTLATGGGSSRFQAFMTGPDAEEYRHQDHMPQDGSVTLWDLAAQKEVGRLDGHRGAVHALAFAGDGKTLASLSWDSTALVWPVPPPPKLPAAPLTAAQLKGLWAVLAGDDAAKAYAATWKLAAAPAQAVPFLTERLRPVQPAKAEVVAQYRAALGSAKFTERQKAADDLRKLGSAAEPVLRALLAGSPPLEVRRRVAPLLEPFDGTNLSGGRLQTVRALEALERMQDAGARRLLRALADGAPGVWLTVQAQAVLRRCGEVLPHSDVP